MFVVEIKFKEEITVVGALRYMQNITLKVNKYSLAPGCDFQFLKTIFKAKNTL